MGLPQHDFHQYTIVIGAQTLHATGYAMGVERDGCVGTGDPDRDTAVIGYFGDGATSQGDVNEAFVFASSYNAPIVFFCQNNQWAISEPIERQSRIPLFRRAAGFGFPGVRVDGNDVLAVHAVTTAALERARSGNGPSLIEAYTYRMGAHTTSDDPTKYRLADELEHWRLKDPIERVRAYLSRHGAADEEFFAEVDAEAATWPGTARRLPGPAAAAAGRRVRLGLRRADPPPGRAAGRVRRLPGDVRRRGEPGMTRLTLAKALNAGLRRALEADPKVVLAGEDIGKLGGVFRVTEGLQKDFGEHRVIDSPLAESGIIGTAVGMAIRGYRPVCEIQFDGFVYPAFDQIVSQVAKMHFRSSGKVRMPMVIRIPFGGGIGAVEHHSESPEAYFVHTPGLKVVACANPVDAYWMIQQAVASDDPVIFFEPKRRYHERADVDEAATPLPLHGAQVCERDGRHAGHLRGDGQDLPDRGRGGGGGRPRPRGDRPALAVPAGHGPGGPVGAADRAGGGGARGAAQPRAGRGGGRPDHRAVLLLPGGAGAAGRRLRHCPIRRAGSRTSTFLILIGCSTRSTARWPTERGAIDGDPGVPAARSGGGAGRGRHRHLAGGGR